MPQVFHLGGGSSNFGLDSHLHRVQLGNGSERVVIQMNANGHIEFSNPVTGNAISFPVETMFGIAEYNVQLDGSALGNVDVGTVKKLPTTVTLKYHFNQISEIIPYIGIGASYTVFFDEDVGRGINNIDYSNELGFVMQIGLDYKIAENTYLNVDVKKFIIDADMRMNNGTINANSVDINPLMIGIGAGYRF